MKKCFYVLAFALCLNVAAKAAPGDTTWVQANSVQLPNYGNYDSTVTFPSGSTTYRKIYMIVTLGKYMCPGTPTYCGDWDYTVQNYLMTPGGDTLELGRLITPYANAGAPRTPWTWQQRYVFDVTDYAAKLQNTATMRLFFSGYSGGFTGNIKFAFIEGTPDRNVVGITKLWNGSFGYGGTPDINTNFPALSETAPAGTVSATLKFTVTGHGQESVGGCCEFMMNSYDVLLNGTSFVTQSMWRDNCGLNELYPQSGTWPVNRGNWCPGALVYSNFHDLAGITAGTNYNVDIQFPAYTHSGGSYTTFATLFYHGAMNKTLDASLDDIIAPTNNENHFRENPIVGSPIVHVKNTGSTTITSITFQYGLLDSAMMSYTWPCNLTSLQESDVVLPQLFQLSEITGVSGTYSFVANITAVNGVADNDATNNSMTSQFISAPRWPSSFKITLKANNQDFPVGSGVSETGWVIYDASNSVVAQRINAAVSTTVTDTVTLPDGLYKLQIYDSSCDGLQWWYHASIGDGVTAGSFLVKQLTGGNINMNGYNYGGAYNNDFGCGFTQYFFTGTPVDHEGITNISETSAVIEAYPNPAQNTVNVDITGLQQVMGTIQVIDALGRVVSTTKCTSPSQQINVSGFANGVYTILFLNEASGNKLQTRLLIAK